MRHSDVRIREPVSHPPGDERRERSRQRSAHPAPAGLARLALDRAPLHKPFLQVSAVRIAADKLHQAKRACRRRLVRTYSSKVQQPCLGPPDGSTV